MWLFCFVIIIFTSNFVPSEFMTNYYKNDFPIDAVITWVNGNDDAHINKMLSFIKDKQLVTKKNFRTRFDQVEEIKYSIDSILKFAPFIRNIFIVTDNQTPSFLNNQEDSKKYSNVSIVDHKVIFKGFEEFLPTFSSRPIETQLYKIPNLAEHFLYFNDDMFLIDNVVVNDFFIEGKPVLRGEWSKLYKNVIKKKVKGKIKKKLKIKQKKRPNHQLAQQQGAIINGFDKYYRFDHTPSPLRKSTFEKIFSINKDLELRNIRHRFRNIEQFIPQGLANHFEIKNNTCTLKNDFQINYIECNKTSYLEAKLKLKLTKKNTLFLCLQSLDQSSQKSLKYILDWLTEKIK